MAESFGDKKHEATPHRRQQAREQGHVARSHDLVAAAVLVGAIGAILYMGDGLARFLRGYAEHQLRMGLVEFDGGDAAAWLVAPLIELGKHLLPLLAIMAVVAVASHVGQTGFLFLPERARLDWNQINPVNGFRRIFSLTNFVKLGFGIGKTAVVLAVAGACLWLDRDRILAAGTLDIPKLASEMIAIPLWTALKIGAALLLLALLDFLFQYWKHESDLRMTDQELREELKTLQGDPQIAARRRAVQRQLVLNRLIAIMPNADFVVTNPTELAVAIQYDMRTMPAPVVIAKGAGVLAQRIRRLALEHGVPIIERKELARALYRDVDVNQPIPTEQYAAVAEILRYVYQLKGQPLPGVGA